MRSAVSKSGDNTWLTGESVRYGEASGGQGVHREVKFEGHADKYRAVIEGYPQMNWSVKGGQARTRSIEAKAFSFTHRTKVPADGTVRKDSTSRAHGPASSRWPGVASDSDDAQGGKLWQRATLSEQARDSARVG